MKIVKLLLMIIIVSSVIGCGSGGGGGGGNDPAITGEPVWNKGLGVVTDSATALFSTAVASSSASSGWTKEISLKELLVAQSIVQAANPVHINSGFKAMSLTSEDWGSAVKYIFLDWNPLSGATNYKIYFLGKDGTMNIEVWNSLDPHPNDPVYTTKAYLDLSDELRKNSEDLVPDAGEYQFKVIAYNKSYSKEYPVITVSIGLLLDKYLKEANIIRTGNQLSWPPIDGATGGYKAAIYSDAALTISPWQTDNAVSPADFGVLPAGDYYGVVFAYANKNGKPAEVTYAIKGITIP